MLLQIRQNDSSGGESFVTLDERNIDQVTYAVAEPDKEYIVKVIVHRNRHNLFVAKHIRIGIYVDGVDCNYWKRLDTDSTTTAATFTTFKGFKVGAEDLRAFVFASPTTTSNPSANVALDNAGTVRIDIYECEKDEGIYQNKSKNYDAPEKFSLVSDSKFYQQPSVTTTSGRNITRSEKFEPLARWKNKSRLSSFTLHYHTKNVIDFLEEAKKNNIKLDLKGSRGRKRLSTPAVVDLTDDCDNDDSEEVNEASKRLCTQGADESSRVEFNSIICTMLVAGSCGKAVDDDEIQHVPVVKNIPLLDLSDDTEKNITYITKEY